MREIKCERRKRELSRRVAVVGAAVFAMCVLTAGCSSGGTIVEGMPSISIAVAPSSVNSPVGQSTTLAINLSNVNARSVSGGDIVITFSAAGLEVVSVTIGSMLSGFVWDHRIDNAAGRVDIAFASANVITGQGTLFIVTVRPKTTGCTSVSLAQVRIVDSSAVPISGVGTAGGQVCGQ